MKRMGMFLLVVILAIALGSWYLDRSNEKDWVLTQYPDASGNQAMCYTLEDLETKDLILIDGGWKENTETVREILEKHGGKVKAWIVTHFHGDHVGAFNELYPLYREGVERVYTTPLVWEDFIEVAASWDTPEAFEAFLNLTKEDEKVVYLYRGEVLQIGRFLVENFNAYDQWVKEGEDIPNNCSLCLKVTAGEESLLFCGDLHGEEMSSYLMETYGEELKADLVQPGHHGNNSLTTEFYELVSPRVMVFDAPEWLMTGEKYSAKDLKAWCEEKQILVYDYTTAPNVFTGKQLRELKEKEK